MKVYSDEIWKALACPYCRSGLQKYATGAKCDACDTLYGYSKYGSLDFRLRKSKRYRLDFEISNQSFTISNDNFKKLGMNPTPEVDFRHISVPWHLTRELLTHFPKAKTRKSLMLDLGCGSAIHRKVCELAGFQYLGLDYDSPEASILADAHALPFKEESFDFILSIALIEHVKFPHVVFSQIYRALKFQGHFIGTVAFLEPYHGMSYYHHSHLGLYNSLQYAGFDIHHISPSDQWTGLRAQACMGLFPKMPKIIYRVLIFPLEILHKMWWRIGRIFYREIDNNKRLLINTGSLSFVTRKK